MERERGINHIVCYQLLLLLGAVDEDKISRNANLNGDEEGLN